MRERRRDEGSHENYKRSVAEKKRKRLRVIWHLVYFLAGERVEKALQYSYRDRRNKKRDMRSLWIQRINAGTRQHGVNYGNFMHGLMKENIQLNRKVLSEISMHEPYSFKALVDISRNAFPGNKNVVHPPRKVDMSAVNV